MFNIHIPGCYNIDNINHNSKPASTKVLTKHSQFLRTSKQPSTNGSIHSSIRNRTRNRRFEIKCLRLRFRPIRRFKRRREKTNGEILQLVLLFHKHRFVNSGDSSGLHSRSCGKRLGIWFVCVCYCCGASCVLVGDKEVSV